MFTANNFLNIVQQKCWKYIKNNTQIHVPYLPNILKHDNYTQL